MIVECINCNKRFNVNSSDIPEKGRLLICNSCNHKWFFKKEIIKKTFKNANTVKTIKDPPLFDVVSKTLESENLENIELDKKTEEVLQSESISINIKNQKKSIIRNFNLLNLTVIFMISFIAVIIILDTFKYPISKIVPDIELILYNLYETINDVRLFFKDLI